MKPIGPLMWKHRFIEELPRQVQEDETFFYPAMDCFSEREQRQMPEAFREFDRKLIHDK